MKTGKVIKVLDPTRVVINLGEEDGVEAGQRFVIYEEGDEVIDPDTGQSLGRLEMSRGTARVEHSQPGMSTLVSDQTQTVERQISEQERQNRLFQAALGAGPFRPSPVEVALGKGPPTEQKTVPRPLEGVKLGDLARRKP